jgi:hypothetical protein
MDIHDYAKDHVELAKAIEFFEKKPVEQDVVELEDEQI